MSTGAGMEQVREVSPRLMARLAGVSYLLVFVTGIYALVSVRGRLWLVANLIATACYIAVTLLFYYLFRPVNRGLSLLAACSSAATTSGRFLSCWVTVTSPRP